MKKYAIAVLALLVCESALYAATEPHFSGQDYLNLSYQQRAEVITSFVEHGRERGIIISKGPVYYSKA